MADDFSTAAQKLVASGKLDQHKKELEKIVASDDGKNVRKMMEENGIEDAVKKGDISAVRSAVGNLLNTPEGARFAKQISELFK